MYKAGILLFCVFVFFSLSLFAQKEANIWYFGDNAGLDFNSGSPVVLNDGMTHNSEGCAVLSNSDGQLLMYTDGVTVWTKYHTVMNNGNNLYGHSSSSQSSVIIPMPGSSNKYYIFTIDFNYGDKGLNYSIVDIDLSGGLGTVTAKNIPLMSEANERLSAIKHANNIDYWIVTQLEYTNNFYTFLVNQNGVNPQPVITSIGQIVDNLTGYLKVSANGKFIVSPDWLSDSFELLSFNNENGTVSNPILFPNYDNVYGAEFSPDGTKFYVHLHNSKQIYQFDLSKKTSDEIIGSGVLIGTSSGNYAGAMQLAPDSKIYISKAMEWNVGVPYLGVINEPNLPGTQCNFIDHAIDLNGGFGRLGLPNFAQSGLNLLINYEPDCFGDSTSFWVEGLSQIYVMLWNFGDPASGAQNTSTLMNPVHKFSSPGTYNVSLTVISFGNTMSLSKEVIIHPTPEINLGNDTLICNNSPVILMPGAGFTNYLWQDNSTQPTFTVNQSGLYWVEVGNEFGCTSRDSILVTITQGPEIFLGNDSTLCVGDTLVLSPGQFQNYLWQDGSSGATFYAFENGTFWVEVSDEFGCVGYDTITLNFQPVQNVFLGNDTLVCFDEILVLDAGAGFENYLWQDGSAGQTLFINQPGTFWVQVGNLCGNSGDTINVSFSQPFDIWLGSDTSFCYGQNLLLNAGDGFSGYLWQNGATTQNFVATNTGNYWVEVTDSLGCMATDTIFIETFMDFDISIGENVVKICKGNYIFLNGPGGYQNYLWQDGSDFTSLLADTAGIYWLEVTDENGCSARDSMQLIVNEIPDKILENDTIICPETGLTLHALPGYSSYLWQDGSADSVFITDQPGKFWITVQDEIGCKGTDTILIKPFQIPDLGVEDQEIICPGDTLVLSTGDENLSYLWQDGSNDPEYLVTEEGDFWVQIETYCGFYTDSVEVRIYKGTLDLGRDTTLCDGEFLSLDPGNLYSQHFWSNGSTESNILVGEQGTYWLKAFDGSCAISDTIYVEVCASIWVPNVFTPNSDGINDTFYALATNADGITAFKMTIFNRLGRIVHEMGNINEVWDGKINGSMASTGAYFWVCDFAARDKNGNIKNHSKQGSVTIVR